MLIQNNEKKLVFLLFLFSLVIRLIILLNSDDIERTGDALQAIGKGWEISGFLNHYSPPLEIYLIKISLLFSKTPQAIRVPNFILGSLLIIPFYYLANIIYGQQIAFLSGLGLSVLYPQIHLSVISSGHISFCFFVITALYLFFKFKQAEQKKTLFLILSGLSLTLATMSRYEAWPLIPILCAFLIKEKKKHLFTFFSVSMIFPLLWMCLNYRYCGNPIAFYFWQLQAIKEEILAGNTPHHNLSQRLIGWFLLFQRIFSPPIFWFGVLGLFWSIFKQKFALPIIFLIISSMLILKVVMGTLFFDIKYAISLIILFLIFIIYGTSILPKVGKIVSYCLILYLSITWIQKAVSERPLAPVAHKEILSYFQKNLQQDEQIAVLGNAFEMLFMNLKASFSSRRVEKINPRFIKGAKRGELEVDPEWMQWYAQYNKPKYIVMDNSDNTLLLLPDIKDILKFFPGAKAECMFGNKEYFGSSSIYKITYESD